MATLFYSLRIVFLTFVTLDTDFLLFTGVGIDNVIVKTVTYSYQPLKSTSIIDLCYVEYKHEIEQNKIT